MISTNLVGRAVTYYSYGPVFLAMGVLHPLAFLLIWRFARMRVDDGRSAS